MEPLASRIPQHRPPAIGAFLKGAAPYLGAIAFALVMHFAVAPNVPPFFPSVMMQVGIAIILAVSLNIINGFTGQFSIGHAGFMAVGAYVAGGVSYYSSLMIWGVASKHGGFLGAGEWIMVAGCLAGAIVAAGFGYLVGLPSLRLRGDYLAIVTLGFGEIIRVLLQRTQPLLFTAEELANADAARLFPPPMGGAQGFERIPLHGNFFWVFFFAAVTVIIAIRLKRSSSGRAFLSIREDEIAARAMGVNITKYKVRAFVLAAFFAGIGGGLYAHTITPIQPINAGFARSFEFIIMVVLGGMGSVSGVILAAIILTILPELLRDFAQYRLIIYALLLIIMMLVRPQGLFGVREIWDYFGASRKRSAGA